MDPSATHYRYVSQTIDEVFNEVSWVGDHRNPVLDDEMVLTYRHAGHAGGAPDPRVYNGNLTIWAEGFQASGFDGEDIFAWHFLEDGQQISMGEFIGDVGNEGDRQTGNRVAPRVLYVPEQSALVMGAAEYNDVDASNWDLSISTSTDGGDSWSRISGADPLLTDLSPHTEVVRIDDTLYWFGTEQETASGSAT